jgi:hypothetical protein
MNPEQGSLSDPELTERHKLLMLELANQITALFRSPEADELIEPCVWIFTHEKEPILELVDRVEHTARVANKKQRGGLSRKPTPPGYRAVFVSGALITTHFLVLDPKRHSDWMTRGSTAD